MKKSGIGPTRPFFPRINHGAKAGDLHLVKIFNCLPDLGFRCISIAKECVIGSVPWPETSAAVSHKKNAARIGTTQGNPCRLAFIDDSRRFTR